MVREQTRFYIFEFACTAGSAAAEIGYQRCAQEGALQVPLLIFFRWVEVEQRGGVGFEGGQRANNGVMSCILHTCMHELYVQIASHTVQDPKTHGSPGLNPGDFISPNDRS